MLAAIHIGTYWTILGQKKFILPGYTVVPFNCSLEGSLKQDVVLVFFKIITFKVVSVKTDRVKMYVHFSCCGLDVLFMRKGQFRDNIRYFPLRKFYLLYYLGM